MRRTTVIQTSNLVIALAGIVLSDHALAATRPVQLSFAYAPNTLAVAVAPSDGNGPTPTGTVSANADGVVLSPVPLGGGTGFSAVASFTVPKAPGPHSVVLQYSGDSNYAAASGTYNYAVAKPTLNVGLASITGTYGTPLTIPVQLVDSSGSAQGTISLLQGTLTLAVANVLNGVASLVVKNLTVGTHPLIARFAGNTTVDDLPFSVTIVQGPTQIKLSGTPVSGTSILLAVQATVTFPGTPGTGSVFFQEAGTTLSTIALTNGTATFPTTGLPRGTHTITATYSGDTNYEASTSPTFRFEAGPLGTTTTATSASVNASVPAGSAVDVLVVVNASGGSVTGQVSLADAGISISTLTLSPGGTASFHVVLATPGSHSLTALFLGSPAYAPSTSLALTINVVQTSFTTVSSASGTVALAPGSLASAFGTGLSSSTAQATLPLGTDLGGVKITVTDSAGKSLPAPLVFVSPSQVNFLIPADASLGTAQLKLVSTTGTFTSAVGLSALAPALFSADSSGSGVAAAFLIVAHSDGTQSVVPVFDCTAKCKTMPLNLGLSSDIAVLSFYGSGFDAAKNVRVRIGLADLAPDFAGPQGQYPGLDQVNVRLPASLAGSGVQPLSIVAGPNSNSLSIEFR